MLGVNSDLSSKHFKDASEICTLFLFKDSTLPQDIFGCNQLQIKSRSLHNDKKKTNPPRPMCQASFAKTWVLKPLKDKLLGNNV